MTESASNDKRIAPPFDSISFACGGWLQFYLFGVAKAMQAQGLDYTKLQVCGCSAGSLAAAGFAYDCDFDAAVDYAKYECITEAHGHVFNLFKLGKYVGNSLEGHVLPNFKDIPHGQLQVALTKLPWLERVREKEFTSAKDLKLALVGSCAAFPFAPLVYRKGSWWIDGGFTDYQPIVDNKTVQVSPFYFRY